MSVLRVSRHSAVYRVPRGHPRPDAVRARLDGTMREGLSSCLARSLSLPDDDPRVVLIRRLSVRVPLRGDWTDGGIADAWSNAIASTLRRTVEDVSVGTMVFADRAAYLKEFLIDLVAGSAHERWYYRSFEGLAMLPLSTAIRTAVLEEPSTGESALLRMSTTAMNSILRSLSEADAGRILRAFSPDAEPSEPAILKALSLIEGGSNQAVLRGYLSVREALPNETAERVGAAVSVVASLLGAAGKVRDVPSMVRAIARKDLAALALMSDVDTAQRLLHLASVPESALRRAVGSHEPSPTPTVRTTRYGGAFLLLEALDELPLDRWHEGAGCLRWVLLLQCLGTDRSYGASRDPVLRDLLSIPPQFDMRAWCRSLRTSSIVDLQQRLRAWQEDHGYLSGRRVKVGRFWIDDERGLYVNEKGASDDPIGAETQARLRYVATDRAYLRPSPGTGVSRRVADGLSPLAFHVLRSFAWRLPGFGRSHLTHLSQNFLACTAEVSYEGDSLRVALSRPPLDLILRMTRIARPDIVVPWTRPPNLSIHL